MNIDEKFIIIPERANAPQTKLQIHLIKNPNSNTILFLHPGGPGSDFELDKLCSLPLSAYATLVFINPRGCGKSEAAPREAIYNLENYILDLEEVRKNLMPEFNTEKIMLLGTSFGGIVAQGYVLKFQKYVSKLILVSTSASHRFIEKAKENIHAFATDEQYQAALKLLNGAFKDKNEAAITLAKLAPLYEDEAEDSKTQNKHNTEDLLAFDQTCFEALNYGFKTFMHEFDYTPLLNQIKIPTLILSGSEDWAMDPLFSEELYQGIPNAQLNKYKCNHLLGIKQHEAYVRDVGAFINEKIMHHAF